MPHAGTVPPRIIPVKGLIARLLGMAEPLIPCAGAVIRDEGGRILVVRRKHPPAPGSWSLPGGRIEPGETPSEAAAREVLEETGLVVRTGALLARLTIGRFDIHDFAADVLGGDLRAGDDADAARWVTLAELAALPTSTGLVDELRRMGV